MKRGRRKIAGVKRTASGRRSQAIDAFNEHMEAVQARMRIFGLSEADARDQKAATVIGRLYLTGELGKRPYSDHMWDAAQRILEMRDAYMRAIKAPDALRNSTGSGGDVAESDAYAHWCQRAVRQYKDAIASVTAENCLIDYRGRNLHAALDYIVFRDEMHPHLIGDCRIALNALHHHLTGGRKSKPTYPNVEAVA